MSAPIARRIARTTSMRWRLVALLILALVARESRAQDSSSAPPSRWMVGGSVGAIGYGGDFAPLEYTTLGMHFTQVRPGALGADFSIGIIPRLLADGFMLIGARGGIALPLALAPSVLLLPSAGLTTSMLPSFPTAQMFSSSEREIQHPCSFSGKIPF